MIGCFCGSLMLIWPSENQKKEADAPKKELNSGEIPPVYIGVITGFVMIIFYSIVQVLTRRMKSVNFSIIQFNYGFFASSSMCLFLISESLVNYYNFKEHNKSSSFKMRLLSYSLPQWCCLLLLSALNYPLQLSQIIAQQKASSAFVALIT